MHAAGVVADHTANGAAAVRSGIGAERELVLFGGSTQMVENDSGLNAGDAALGIELENLCHVLGKIEYNGHIAALSGERSSSAAAKHRRGVFAADGNGGDNIICIPGDDDADWHLAIVGGVCCVKRAAAIIEAHLAADVAAKIGFQRVRRVEGCSVWHSGLAIKIHSPLEIRV